MDYITLSNNFKHTRGEKLIIFFLMLLIYTKIIKWISNNTYIVYKKRDQVQTSSSLRCHSSSTLNPSSPFTLLASFFTGSPLFPSLLAVSPVLLDFFLAFAFPVPKAIACNCNWDWLWIKTKHFHIVLASYAVIMVNTENSFIRPIRYVYPNETQYRVMKKNKIN